VPKRLLGALKSLVEPVPEQRPPEAVRGAERLEATVRSHMGEADEETQRIVVSVAGLLACVAYADHVLEDAELSTIRQELSRVQGLSSTGVDAACTVLREEIAAVAVGGDHAWVRDLRRLADRETRVEVLAILVDLAAADDDLSLSEVNYLRRLATALGLDQADYDAAQARHRDKLSTLT